MFPSPQIADDAMCTSSNAIIAPRISRDCNVQSCKKPKLRIKLKLQTDFDTVTQSAELQKKFLDAFINEIANSLGIDVKLIIIVGISRGSVNVEFDLIAPEEESSGTDAETTAKTPAQATEALTKLAKNLKNQMDDPSSKLRTEGTYARLASDILESNTIAPEEDDKDNKGDEEDNNMDGSDSSVWGKIKAFWKSIPLPENLKIPVIGGGGAFIGLIAVGLVIRHRRKKGRPNKGHQELKDRLSTMESQSNTNANGFQADPSLEMAVYANPMGKPNRKTPKDSKSKYPQTAPGWTEHTDRTSGKTYFYNRETGQTTWSRP
jgi:hypothetical protein